MPGQGSLSFGVFPDMREKEHRILEAGIPLFQLVYPKPLTFDKDIMGPFGVIVHAGDPDAVNSSHQVEWLHGGNAHFSFERVNQRGLAVGWLADDPWMHNRVFLMTNPAFASMLKQERMPSGDIRPGTMVMFEIGAMDKILREPVPIFRVFVDGREACSFLTKAEAEAYIDEAGQTEVKLDARGALLPMRVKRSKYSIVPGEVRIWKKEVADLIARERNRNQFGWTESKEFENKWKPLIIEEIKKGREQFAEQVEAIDVEAAAESIKNLPDEVIEAIARRVQERRKKKPGARVMELAEEEEETAS
jgi:hypothetical protein